MEWNRIGERNFVLYGEEYNRWKSLVQSLACRVLSSIDSSRPENKQATELSVTIRSVLLRETYPLISVHGPPSIRFTPRGRLTELRHSVTGDEIRVLGSSVIYAALASISLDNVRVARVISQAKPIVGMNRTDNFFSPLFVFS